jgi:hypothetical protein
MSIADQLEEESRLKMQDGMKWKEDQGDSGCSSLGCAAEKANSNHDALESLIGPVILTF